MLLWSSDERKRFLDEGRGQIAHQDWPLARVWLQRPVRARTLQGIEVADGARGAVEATGFWRVNARGAVFRE
jgi:hypothetical protein